MAKRNYIRSDNLAVKQLIPTYGVESLLASNVTVDLGATGPADPALFTAPDDGNYRFVTKVVLKNPDGVATTGPIFSASLGASGSGYTMGDVLTTNQTGATGGTITVETATTKTPAVVRRDTILGSANILAMDIAMGASGSYVFIRDNWNQKASKINLSSLAVTAGPSLVSGYSGAISADSEYLFYGTYDQDSYDSYICRCSVVDFSGGISLRVYNGDSYWDIRQRASAMESDGEYLYVYRATTNGPGKLEKRLRTLSGEDPIISVDVTMEVGMVDMVVSGGNIYIVFGGSRVIKKYSCSDLSEVTGSANTYSWEYQPEPRSPCRISTDGTNLIVTLTNAGTQTQVMCEVRTLSNLSLAPLTTFGSYGTTPPNISGDCPTAIYNNVIYTGYSPNPSSAKPMQRWDIGYSGGAIETISIKTKGTGYKVENGLATTVSPSGGVGATINVENVNLEAIGTLGSDVACHNWGTFSLVGMANSGHYFGLYTPSMTGGSVGLAPLDNFNLAIDTPSPGVTCMADIFGFMSPVV